MENRFVLIENNPRFPNDGKTCWWWDTTRPYIGKDSIGPYIAVQTYVSKDPNQFIYIDGLRILFQDQAEYYFVCPSCYSANSRLQWSGSTHGGHGWRERAEAELAKWQNQKGWCEFCDPIFGNGGWL